MPSVKRTPVKSEGVRWQVFPRNKTTSKHQVEFLGVLNRFYGEICTPFNRLQSNEVLGVLRLALKDIGYQIEGPGEKIIRPVLFGESGKKDKSYNVDGWHEESGTVLEVEAGQAVENNRFALDILKACSIQGAKNLIMAIPSNYHPERLRKEGKPPKREFDSVVNTLDSLYVSNRFQMPLDSILVVGY
jgi:hypothetical protein